MLLIIRDDIIENCRLFVSSSDEKYDSFRPKIQAGTVFGCIKRSNGDVSHPGSKKCSGIRKRDMHIGPSNHHFRLTSVERPADSFDCTVNVHVP
jgi:hypothetical protein